MGLNLELRAKYFENGKYSGFKNEKTIIVTEFIQDHLLTMETTLVEKQFFRENYRIEPLSDNFCRVYFTIQVGNVPKVAEYFMRQSMKKEQPQTAARLKAVLGGNLYTKRAYTSLQNLILNSGKPLIKHAISIKPPCGENLKTTS